MPRLFDTAAVSKAIYEGIRAGVEVRGQMIGNNDLWFAAHALANNEKEFRRVRGLQIRNWMAAR